MNGFDDIALVTSLSIVNSTINRLVSPSLHILYHEGFGNPVTSQVGNPVFFGLEAVLSLSDHETTYTYFDLACDWLDDLLEYKVLHEILVLNLGMGPLGNRLFNDEVVLILFVDHLGTSNFIVLSFGSKLIKLHELKLFLVPVHAILFVVLGSHVGAITVSIRYIFFNFNDFITILV